MFISITVKHKIALTILSCCIVSGFQTDLLLDNIGEQQQQKTLDAN